MATLPAESKPAAAITPALLEAAAAHLTECQLCPHGCGPDRATASGLCRVGKISYIASEMLHMGEEALLRPAHAIFFSGCTAHCSFCTAATFAFVPTYGVAVTPEQLAARILRRQEQGARSICFIGGDPVPHIPFVLATLAALGARKRVPAVFNSNFYLSDQALDLLEPAIDLFLPDLKFGPDDSVHGCGPRLGAMPGYWSTVTANIDRIYAHDQQLIVRHLLMPGHFDCCTEPVLRWLAQRPGIRLSLLTQYIAPAQLKGALAAPLSLSEIQQARRLAHQLALALVE